MEINYKEIGKRIRSARKARHMTQEELAELVGVNTTHISNIESGKKPFSFKIFVRLYTALKVNPDSLLPKCDECGPVAKEEFASEGLAAASKLESLQEAVDAAIVQWWQENADK